MQSPLLRVSNPMSEYRTQKDSALQLLGDVCLKPTLSEGSAERAAGAAAPELGVKPEVEVLYLLLCIVHTCSHTCPEAISKLAS